jgi:hypothetical protein
MDLKNKRYSYLIPMLLVSAIVVVSFAFNFSMLDMNKAPPGADYGNYLTQGNILQGQDLRGWGLRHQPVFFFFLDAVRIVLDPFTALKFASAFVFAIVAVPFFLYEENFRQQLRRGIVYSAFCVLYWLFRDDFVGRRPEFSWFFFSANGSILHHRRYQEAIQEEHRAFRVLFEPSDRHAYSGGGLCVWFADALCGSEHGFHGKT